MKTITANNITWLDIKGPKEKDLEELKEKFQLHPMIARQYLPAIHRPKIEEYPNQLFLVLHFPVFDKKTRQNRPAELDFVVTSNTLITSHTEDIPALKIFFDDCSLQNYHQQQYFKSPGCLLLSLLDVLIDACLPMLDHVAEEIENIEKEVFAGKERAMLNEIALVKKDLIDFRRAIKPQKSVLELLYKKTDRLFGRGLKPLAQEVVGSNLRVWNNLENHKELIEAIEQTNNSLLSYKISDIVKILTVVSFITFPLSVVVGFFGMNIFDSIPIVRQNPYTWLVILLFMLVGTGLMLIYFRRKRWL